MVDAIPVADRLSLDVAPGSLLAVVIVGLSLWIVGRGGDLMNRAGWVKMLLRR
jgi:hypothetical protein